MYEERAPDVCCGRDAPSVSEPKSKAVSNTSPKCVTQETLHDRRDEYADGLGIQRIIPLNSNGNDVAPHLKNPVSQKYRAQKEVLLSLHTPHQYARHNHAARVVWDISKRCITSHVGLVLYILYPHQPEMLRAADRC